MLSQRWSAERPCLQHLAQCAETAPPGAGQVVQLGQSPQHRGRPVRRHGARPGSQACGEELVLPGGPGSGGAIDAPLDALERIAVRAGAQLAPGHADRA